MMNSIRDKIDLQFDIPNSGNTIVELHEDFTQAKVRRTTETTQATARGNRVYVSEGCEIQPYVVLDGDIFIGRNVVIGPYTFIRGPVYIGDNSIIGSHSEIVRSFIDSSTSVSHHICMIDSFVGKRCNVSGYSWFASMNMNGNLVKARYKDEEYLTEKFGTWIEDDCMIGAGIGFMPGSYVESNSMLIGPGYFYAKTFNKMLKERPASKAMQ